jgi:predicted NACHT family NTPase
LKQIAIFIVNYCAIFAKRYEKLAKEKIDSVLPDVKFVRPVLVRPVHHTITTPRADIDEIPGEKVGFEYTDLLNRKDGSKLLLQGRPGCGKSRLMKQISCELANKNCNGQNRKFVIFVKLRELSEHKFDEKDRLKYLLCTAGAELSDVDKETLLTSKFDRQGRGSNIIFILDGFDECDQKYTCKSTTLIRDIIMNEETAFENSTVIVSSRPSATYDFQKANDLEIVEIIGFKRNEVIKYLQNAKKEDLTKYLDDNSKIMNMCYLPLYCTMLVQLSDCVRDPKELPHTESGFYEHFALSTYNRYIRKNESARQLEKFIDLREEDDFKEICKFAYNRTKDSKQVFKASDFFNRNRFDLLVAEQVVIPVGGGETNSYSFVHLTFQEYLTAIYIAWYHEKPEQNEIVAKHCSENSFHVVWQFLFGILKPYSEELFNKIQGATADNQLLHVQCAYESQDPTACAKVLDFHHNSLRFLGIRPSDLPCLTFVLKSTPAVKCKLEFHVCSFSVKDARTFLEGVACHHQLSLTILYVDVVYET